MSTHPRPVTGPGPDDVGADREAGFGLVEIMISMVLLGLLFAAFAPLLVNALRSASASARLATATQLANEQIERARAGATSCADYVSFLAAPTPPMTDARNITYSLAQTDPATVTCPPSGESSLQPYWVEVHATGVPTSPLVRIQTAIWVVS